MTVIWFLNSSDKGSQILKRLSRRTIPSTPLTKEEIRSWREPGDTEIMQIPLRRGLLKRNFSSAGFSSDCSSVFFFNSSELYVYSLDPEKGFEILLQKSFGTASDIRRVAVSRQFALVSTSQRLELYGLWNCQWNPHRQNNVLLKWPDEGWDLTGLSIQEEDFGLIILVGQRQEGSGDEYKGRLLLYQITLTEDLASHEQPQRYTVPDHDFPKAVFLEIASRKFVCITAIRSTVLVWNLPQSKSTIRVPFAVTRSSYRPV